MTVAYPKDVVAVFVQSEEMSTAITEELLRRLFGESKEDAKRAGRSPSPSILERLVETMLFASMTAEEGRTQSIGIVYAESKGLFEVEDMPWDLTAIEPSGDFNVKELSKLAALCDFPRSLLAVTGESETLRVHGVARPHSRTLRSDRLVRVLAPRPGTVVVARGAKEVVRYESGSVRSLPPDYLDAKPTQRQQWTSITNAALQYGQIEGFSVSDMELDLFQELGLLVARMSALGRGGLIAVLGPGQGYEELPAGCRRLSTPLEYGRAYWRHVDERHKAAANWARFSERHDLDSKAPLERMREQIARLTTVDGAVVMSHSLQVLGFGAKLLIDKRLGNVVSGPSQEPWPSLQRGARHRAAATFARKNRDGVAVIVSQDGDAAIFAALNKKSVIHWPLSVPVGDLSGQ